MTICKIRSYPSPLRPYYEAFLYKIWLIHLLKSTLVLTDRSGNRICTDRSTFKCSDNGPQYLMIYRIKTKSIYLKFVKSIFCYIEINMTVAHNLCEITNSLQESIRNPWCAPASHRNFFCSREIYSYVENITFSNFEDVRVNDVYYALDVSYLHFKYQNGLDNFLKGTFTFAFYDRYSLFPDFEIGDSMYRYISLVPNLVGEVEEAEIYFTFNTAMYYDPLTHDCSTIQKENYLPTNHLMLPFKYAQELKYLPCYIELKVQSHTEFKITGKFMMTYLKKYFGDCEDSEFCYEVHQSDDTNIREKVIEVII